MNRVVVLALWAATLVAAFGAGRGTAPPGAISAPEDLGASIRLALGEGDPLERTVRTADLVQQLDAENLPGVRAVYDQMLTVIDQVDIRPFVAAWVRFDPAGALDHTLAWPFETKREFGVEAAMLGWAQRDPLAARLAYEQVAPDHPGVRRTLFMSMVAGWAHSGQEGLDRYVAELPPPTQETAAGTAIGALMRKGGPEATLGWVEPILRNEAYDARFKRSVFRRATRSVARWQPERGVAWATAHAGEEYAKDGMRLVAEQWGAQDGPATMQWLRDQPEGEPREQAVREGFAGWLNADSRSAREWLSAQTLTAFHDPAIEVYASRLDDRAPEKAVGWCERILEPKRRTGCLRGAAMQWYRVDAAAAEAWLQQSPLDEEARSAVRKPPKRRKRVEEGRDPR
ncbi:MAG TPA: hypothetical protein VIY27_06800 [Myxococcota bacterium]